MIALDWIEHTLYYGTYNGDGYLIRKYSENDHIQQDFEVVGRQVWDLAVDPIAGYVW